MRLAAVGALLALVSLAFGVILWASVRPPDHVDLRPFRPYLDVPQTTVTP